MLTDEALKTLLNASNAGRQVLDSPDGGRAVVVPTGYSLQKLPPLEPPLLRIGQRVTLHTPDAFIGYLNAYKTSETRIFAEPGFLADGGKPRFVAVLDYHQAWSAASAPEGVPAPEVTDGARERPSPRRAVHVATYAPRYSEAWERWTGACGEAIGQREFAEFIEECRADIVTPAAGLMLDVVRTFKAKKKADFDSFIHEHSGSVKLHFTEEVEKHGPSVSMPEILTIGIPVYYRDALNKIDVFIRFRLAQGVVFTLKIDRPDRVEELAFEDLAEKIHHATDVPLHVGRI